MSKLIKGTLVLFLFFISSSLALATPAPASKVKSPTTQSKAVIAADQLPLAAKAPVMSSSKVTLDDLLGKPAATSASTGKGGAAKTLASDGFSSGTQNFSRTLSVDPRSGASAVSIPLYVPEGRGGVTPSMGLGYSSSGGSGPFGWGWGMEMGSVVRSTKNGTPKYDSTDTIMAVLGGKSFELVNVSGNEYRSKFDDERVRFFINSGVWSAKDKSGTTYFFGSRTGSTINDGGDRIYKWRLDRVEDLFGNVMVVDYAADESFEVRYGLKVGKSTTADVNDRANFAYVINAAVQSTDRPDVMTDYKPGFAVSERRLVSTITITGGGNLLKKYNFTYGASAKTNRSLLKAVTETGADNTMTQPVVNLGYNDTESVAYSVNSITDPLQGDNLWQSTFNYTVCTANSCSLPTDGPYVVSEGIFDRGDSTIKVDLNGDIHLRILPNNTSDQNITFTTNVYSASSKNANFKYSYSTEAPSDGDITLWVNNVPCDSFFASLSWWEGLDSGIKSWSFPLNKGYNILTFSVRYKDWLSVDSRPYLLSVDFLSSLASQVDLMNSLQVIFPQLTGDFNGDGKIDAATYFTDTGTLKVALSNGPGFLPKSTWIDNFAKNQKLILGDFNGNGRTDIASYDPGAHTVRVALSDGTKFTDSGIWLNGVPSGADVYTADFNGDGRSDLYLMTKPSGWQVQIAQSTGTAFSVGNTYFPQIGSTGTAVLPADLNGDGLTDLIGFDQATGTWSVNLNTNGFTSTGVYSVTGFGANKPPAIADYNQDGRVDIGYFDAANKQVVYRPSIPDGFGPQQTLTFNFTLNDPLTTQLQTADFNGDGVLDFMTFDSMGRSDIALSNGKFQDLLTGYDNGFGGKISMTYASSADLNNNYLPFAIPVIQSVTAANNLGDSLTTSYSYSGGLWNPAEREMYGFKEARTIDADGNYSLTQYNQDNLYMRGRPDRTAVYGADNKLYQETKFQWNNDPVIAGRQDVRFVSLKRSDSFITDTTSANPVNLRTAVEYIYDVPLGLPIEVRDLGQVDWTTGADTGNDFIRTAMTYAVNDTNNVAGILTSKITYDSANNILAKNYAYYDGSATLGAVTRGLATRSDVWNKIGTTEALLTSTNTYNSFGQLLTSTDPLLHTSTVTYDPVWSMFPLTTTNAKGFKRSSQYFGVGGVPLGGGIWGLTQSQTDVNNQVLSSTYDALGRVTSQTNPLDSAAMPTISYEYQTKENYRVLIAHKRIEHGQPYTLDSYTYIDGLGRSLMVKTPAAAAGKYVVSSQVSLNKRGLVAKEYPPYFSTSDYSVLELPGTANPGSSYEYDVLGRKVKTTFPDGSYAALSFTPQSTTVIDPNGHQTIQVTDSRGRIVRVENYTGATGQAQAYPATALMLYASTTYSYDLLGNLRTVTDAKNNVTSMTYDALGRKLTMSDPDMHYVSYEYNALGQLLKQTDAKNCAFAFTYDVLGRPLTKAQANTGLDKVSYIYDMALMKNSIGRLWWVSYPSGQAGFGYDALGQETSSSKVVGGTIYGVKRAYNALGQIKNLGYADGKTSVLYGYNAAGMLNSVEMQVLTNGVSVPQSIISGIDYTANGSIQKITYGNGAVAAYVYDPLTFRLKTMAVVDKNSAAVQYNAYAYDPAGNILRVADNIKVTAKIFSYDELGRMITSRDGAEAVIGYRYDEIGNIIQKGALVYTYGELGAGSHAVTSINDGSAMTYDANGNMTSYRTTARTQYYAYDASNRLIKVEAQGAAMPLPVQESLPLAARTMKAVSLTPGNMARHVAAEYVYDGDGGRTSKTVYVNNSGSTTPVTTTFIGDLTESTDGIQTNFVFMGSNRVAAYDGAKVRWFVGDHLGSTSVVLDETSAIKEKITYTPWGEVKSYDKFGAGAEVARFYFTGKKLDDETGLYYFGARYYNPKLGRFLTADTIVQSPYNPQTLNRYTYCNNNPVNLVDPTGHSWFKKVFGGGSGFVASAIGAVLAVAITVMTGGAGGVFMASLGWSSFWAGVGAGALGGAVGGAVTGGLLGGTQGALQGAMMGAAFGAVGGGVGAWGQMAGTAGQIGRGVGYAMLAGSAAYSAKTGTLDMFAGAIIGGIGGYAVGTRISTGQWPGSQPNTNTSRQSPSGRAKQTLSTDQTQVTIGDQANFDPEPGTGISVNMPDDRGFLFSERSVLDAGTLVDRYGPSTGEFMSPAGTAFGGRSLPASYATRTIHTYQVTKPFDVYAGPTAPAHGQQGLFVQYDLGKGRSVQSLVDQGLLKEVP